jgi:hypothetical protein
VFMRKNIIHFNFEVLNLVRAGSGPMRPCATARSPYQEGAHNFVYPSIYIPIHLKKLQGLTQLVPCGLLR